MTERLADRIPVMRVCFTFLGKLRWYSACQRIECTLRRACDSASHPNDDLAMTPFFYTIFVLKMISLPLACNRTWLAPGGTHICATTLLANGCTMPEDLVTARRAQFI